MVYKTISPRLSVRLEKVILILILSNVPALEVQRESWPLKKFLFPVSAVKRKKVSKFSRSKQGLISLKHEHAFSAKIAPRVSPVAMQHDFSNETYEDRSLSVRMAATMRAAHLIIQWRAQTIWDCSRIWAIWTCSTNCTRLSVIRTQACR